MESPSGRVLVLAGVIATILAAGDAAAEPDRVRVGVLDDWPPEYTVTAEGKPGGFAVEVFDEVARRANLRAQYRSYETFVDLQAALVNGEIDVIPTLGISENRREFAAFTQPVETFAIALFVRAHAHVPRSLRDLRGHEVAVVEANLAATLFDESPGVNIREYHDVRPALYDLLAGHVDALAYPKPVLERVADDAGLGGRVRAAPFPLLEVKRALAVRRGNTALLSRLDAAVGAFVHSADYRRVYRRWYATPPSFWSPVRIVYLSAAAFLLLAIGFFWFRARARGALSREERGRRTAEAARRRVESQYEVLLDQASDGVFVIDDGPRILEASRRGCEMLGFERDELVGKHVAELIAPEDLNGTPLHMERMVLGETVLVERRLVRKDGTSFAAEIGARRVSEDTAVGVVRDVSARKAEEDRRREQEAALRQAQKMEAIGRLAGGVAHDFNNLLTAVSGYAEILTAELADRPDALRDLAEIKQAVQRGGALSRQLLAFSRRQTLEPEVLDLGAVANELRGMLVRLIGEDIALAVDASSTCRVKADRGQLEQVIVNLVVNARDALPHGGHVWIRVRDQTVEQPLPSASGAIRPGRYVVVEVEDDGAGIDPGIRTRIFEPFFSTKPAHQGTGLGLSTVLGIVEQSGGWVDVDSEVGRFSRFRFYLPVTEERPAGDVAGSAGAVEPVLAEKVALVVEDEGAVRRIVVRELERAGLTVHAAPTPAIARELAAGIERVDILVTDVVMPGSSGPELATDLCGGRPDLRVLFMSGYADGSLEGELGSDPRRAFLQKPFTVDQLLRTVAQLLRGRRDEVAQATASLRAS